MACTSTLSGNCTAAGYAARNHCCISSVVCCGVKAGLSSANDDGDDGEEEEEDASTLDCAASGRVGRSVALKEDVENWAEGAAAAADAEYEASPGLIRRRLLDASPVADEEAGADADADDAERSRLAACLEEDDAEQRNAMLNDGLLPDQRRIASGVVARVTVGKRRDRGVILALEKTGKMRSREQLISTAAMILCDNPPTACLEYTVT